MKLLFDADVIIDFTKGRSKSGFDLEELSEQNNFFISSLTLTEILAGTPKTELKNIKLMLNQFATIAPIDNICTSAGEIIYKYHQKGLVVATVDAIIAATAMENNLILVSHDGIYKHIKGLNIYSPTK